MLEASYQIFCDGAPRVLVSFPWELFSSNMENQWKYETHCNQYCRHCLKRKELKLIEKRYGG